MDRFDPESALEIIERERISTIWGFDVHYLMLRRHPRFGAYNVSSLKRTMIGSDPRSFDEIKSIGLDFQGNIYGCSEYLSNFFPYRDRFDDSHMKFSHGRPMGSVQQKISNMTTGETLGVNQLGEICVKGPGLFKGYYKMPELTDQAIDLEGYFHTGDLGMVDKDGYTYYRGRLKETVKTGGENVSAREVEMFLESETPWVAVAQVIGVPDPKWGEAVTAMVELKAGESSSEEEIRSFCKGKIAGYKIPKRIFFVDRSDWPITLTGKFDKAAMKENVLAQLGIDPGMATS
jgi:fatty-acyl-CoA synthase